MLEFVDATDRSITVGLTPHFDETEAIPRPVSRSVMTWTL
jgi:hypothetical protein